MAGVAAGDPSNCGTMKVGCEHDNLRSGWYFSRKEIEENSLSRRDGIDLKKEAYLRKSYCTFLQDLGMRLKVPQVTIATAVVFCHRFFLRQSHVKNDRRTIATVCMFLAGKVEETPRPLKDVIIVSYEIIHKKDPSAVQRIKQKDVYEQQKELILVGERLVLTTLGFDLNVHHPYKPLVEAIKKFKVAQNSLAQVAWNFVNDGLRTSLCLQFKAHHIAAGAIFLAAKFLKVKLPSDVDRVWWQELDVNPRQLEDVSNQMLELYEQSRPAQSSHANEVDGIAGGGNNQPAKAISTASENSVSLTGASQGTAAVKSKQETEVVPPPRSVSGQSNAITHGTISKSPHNNNNGDEETRSTVLDHYVDTEGKEMSCDDNKSPSSKEYEVEALSSSKSSLINSVEDGVDDQVRPMNSREWKDETSLSVSCNTGSSGSKYMDATTTIDKDKVKAAIAKQKKLRNDPSKRIDIIDDDDLIERELESGIEMTAENKSTKLGNINPGLEPLNRQQQASHGKTNPKSFDHGLEENVEEGEFSSLEEHELGSLNLHKHKGSEQPDLERDHKRSRIEIIR